MDVLSRGDEKALDRVDCIADTVEVAVVAV